jgi:hypothetical protein
MVNEKTRHYGKAIKMRFSDNTEKALTSNCQKLTAL